MPSKTLHIVVTIHVQPLRDCLFYAVFPGFHPGLLTFILSGVILSRSLTFSADPRYVIVTHMNIG